MSGYVREAGRGTRVTATGVSVLTSAAAYVLGIQVATVLTGQKLQLWYGNATGTPVIGTMSAISDTYYPMPLECPTGLTYAVTNEDVDLTIYWNPSS